RFDSSTKNPTLFKPFHCQDDLLRGAPDPTIPQLDRSTKLQYAVPAVTSDPALCEEIQFDNSTIRQCDNTLIRRPAVTVGLILCERTRFDSSTTLQFVNSAKRGIFIVYQQKDQKSGYG